MRNISKSFIGVDALKDVSLSVKKGEVHAICGENGAGKSTLMKILNGVYRADMGEIWIKNDKVEITSPLQAQHNGISIIYQEFNLVDSLSIAENIFLGRLRNRKAKILWNDVRNEAQKILDRIGCKIDSKTLVGSLSTSQKQLVEICKALSFNADIIVMDEPTSALTDAECKILYQIITELKAKNISIIYISHKLDEIFKLSDRITVLRDGAVIRTLNTSTTSRDEIISLMVGRSVELEFPKRQSSKSDAIVLDIKGLNARGWLKNIDVTLKKGEILGIAGLVGSGRTELVRAIFGADVSQIKSMRISGNDVKIRNPKHAIAHKVALVTEDRKQQGLILNFNISKNISITNISKITNYGILNGKKEAGYGKTYVDMLSIKTPSVKQKCIYLSGGNQQKVVLGKWLYSDSQIIILDEPTRGIDVGSKFEIYTLMNKLVEEGKSIIMISSEMPEILGMSDRILVMHEGKMKGELDNSNRDITPEQVMKTAIVEGTLDG
jgi:ABC-type sugar transport system ATPase subunit